MTALIACAQVAAVLGIVLTLTRLAKADPRSVRESTAKSAASAMPRQYPTNVRVLPTTDARARSTNHPSRNTGRGAAEGEAAASRLSQDGAA